MRSAKNIRRVILWGGTGQAKVVRPIIEHYGGKIVAVFDDDPTLQPPFDDVPLCFGKKGFQRWFSKEDPGNLGFCIAIGNPRGVRVKLSEWLIKKGLTPVSVIHPSAVIADNAILGEGCQCMAGAIINPLAIFGRQCIINTNASVDHECVLGDEVELAPGATLCGQVTVENDAWIGAGVVVLPRITIGKGAIVGAGAVVIRDVPSGVTVVGVPAARVLAQRKS